MKYLHEKWRPTDLSGCPGQEHVTRTLLNAIAADSFTMHISFAVQEVSERPLLPASSHKAINCKYV
jgi:hypothetical protein